MMQKSYKMINNTYDQEEDMINLQNLPNPNPTSRQRFGFKNPRILGVSRGYGSGKDRHTKVWTIKGLKDRRIRLSEPAAVLVYHLQDQLGLSQPSKVIDWLLDVTKHDVDKLPPLHMALQDFNPSTCVHQDFKSTQLSVSSFYNTPDYDELHPSPSNIYLSRFSHHLDRTYEAEFLSSFSSTGIPQYIMHNQSQLLNSSSLHVVVPHNLDTRAKVMLELNMSSKVSSELMTMVDRRKFFVF